MDSRFYDSEAVVKTLRLFGRASVAEGAKYTEDRFIFF